jgi:hypothetical protein
MRPINWPAMLALSIFSVISTAALGRAESVDIMHDFSADTGSPSAGLIQGINDRAPFLYGMSALNSGGTVFKLLFDGTPLNVIHSLACPADGCINDSILNSTGLIQLSDGSLYGTTQIGGTANVGYHI